MKTNEDFADFELPPCIIFGLYLLAFMSIISLARHFMSPQARKVGIRHEAAVEKAYPQ